MKVCVVGTGYVGLVAGACLAEMGNDVICVDQDQQRIRELKQGRLPFFEPGLDEIVLCSSREGRLQFSTDTTEAVAHSEICFLAVGTPFDQGQADLSSVYEAIRQIARGMSKYLVIAVKSTVPVGTCAKLRELVAGLTEHPFAVVSNPEFLKQGHAVYDFLKPDRVVIGADDQRSLTIMKDLYAPFLRTGKPVICMDVASAEMTKYVANAFLATKISFINEMAALCEAVGADIELVRAGICTDPRIGSHFLFPGIGYGGSCFPKDIQALIQTAAASQLEVPLLNAANHVNGLQTDRFLKKIRDLIPIWRGCKFACWGLSYKPNTDDVREAPSLRILESLLKEGATVSVYDPRAKIPTQLLNREGLHFSPSAYEALTGAEALLVLTEWNEFRRPDFSRIAQAMKTPTIFDGRNLYEPARLATQGIRYICVGRESLPISAS